MRKLRLRKPYPQATSIDLEKLQSELNINFPPLYLEFLLAGNAGSPDPCNNYFKTHGRVPGGDVCISMFFLPTLKHSETSGLIRALKVYSERVPTGMLPIASDDFGNLVLLSWKSKEDTVFFWDHEAELLSSKSTDITYAMALNLGDFVEGLESEPK